MNKIKNDFDAVRAEDKLKNDTLEYIYRERERREKHTVPKFRYAVALAAFLTVFFGIGGYSMLYSAVSYISIDVNPSVELALNRLDRVVKVSAYNDEGAAILDGMNLKGKSYTAAIDALFSNQSFQKYIDNGADVNFTVVSDNEKEITEGIKKCGGYSQYNSACHGADSEMHSKAHEYGISTGKYKAYVKLKEEGIDINIDDCRNMSLKQLYEILEQNNPNSGLEEKGCGGAQRHQHNKGKHE